MSFPENIRVKVRRAANFRCCRCEAISIDAHHIIPTAAGGPDTFENAAPLCQSCHANFGDNPKKQKEIRQMRDRWYEHIAATRPTEGELLERLDELALRADHGEDVISELQAELERLREASPQQIQGVVTATRLGDGVYANVKCNRCKSQIGFMSGGNACPRCGAPLH